MRIWVSKDKYGKWTTTGKSKNFKTDEDLKCYIKVVFVKCEEPKEDNVQIVTKTELFGAYEEYKKDSFGNYAPTGRTLPSLIVLDYELMAKGVPNSKRITEYNDLDFY